LTNVKVNNNTKLDKIFHLSGTQKKSNIVPNIVLQCLQMWVSITSFTLLFIISCVILLIPITVKSGLATVPEVAVMPKAANPPALSFDLLAKPKLTQLTFHIQEYNIPLNDSAPLYPLYDNKRNVIWVGDTSIDSSRILEFNLTSTKFIEHKLNGTSIVTVMAFDHNNNNEIWYVDPLLKHLAHYDPSANSTKLYSIPTRGIISRIAIDLNNNVWLTSPSSNELLKFNSQTKNFTMLHLPTTNATPIGILLDKATGLIWIAEGIGKLASIDPTANYKINEYPMHATNNKYYFPNELFMSTDSDGNLYISDHDNHTVSVFNPILKTFKTYPVFNPNALPFGMAMDNYGYLWVAEHTTNKIAAIDPENGQSREIEIPKANPYIQFLTPDSKGNIWFAEQRGNALGVIIHAHTKPS
jgi:copper transport protein